jgi:chemotaxis protein MotB
VALLNEQIAEMRTQVASLQSLLNLAEESDREAQVQIETLGSQLNTALARVVSEERQRRALEESERIRLEAEAIRLAEEAERLQSEAERLQAEAQDLAQFKSDFFGELRQILEGQDRVRIEGDRFVFSSEVLFEPGSARLSSLGEAEIANIAGILRSIADDIPTGIDWVIRVDGHTDNIPVGGGGRYRDNWELSQARALSVVRFMSEDLDIDPRRLAANGFGEFQPIDPADTPEARAQNRRIELKLTER